MPARNVTGGTALAGSLTVNATIAAGATVHQGSVAFAGAGGLVANSVQRLNSSTALAGAGGFVTNAALIQPATVAFAGAGGFSANLNVPATVWQGTAALAGAGNLVASTLQYVAGIYDETGAATASDTLSQVGKFTELEFGIQLDRDNLATGDVLEFRVYLDGVALDSYVTPSITIAAAAWAATAAFAGVGGLTVDASLSRVALIGEALLSGAGQFALTPQLQMAASAGLAGAGSLTAELAKFVSLVQGTAAFAGTGQFTAEARRFINLTAEAFAGAGTLDVTSVQWLGATAAFGGIGSFTADAVQLGKIYGSALLQGVGALSAATTQQLAVSALYAGAGNFAIQPTNLQAAVAASLAGTGSFDIQPSLRMRATAQFGGAGLFYADLSAATYELQGQAQFDGLGELTALARLRLPTAAQMDGAGNFTAEAMRFIPLSETFSGAGSFLVGDVQQILAALASYGAAGSLAVYTTMISARAEWLVCASISIAPELPVAITLNPEMAADPSMKVC